MTNSRAGAIAFLAGLLLLYSCEEQTDGPNGPPQLPTAKVVNTTPIARVTPSTSVPDNAPFTVTSTMTTLSPTIRWESQQTLHVITAAPAVAKGIIYVLGDTALFAWDAKTGENLWSFPVVPFGSTTPLVVDNTVYVAVPGNPEFSSLRMKATAGVYAIDTTTHQQKWLLSVEEKDATDPVYYNNTLFFAGHGLALPDEPHGGHVYAIDTTNGSLKWEFPTTKDVRTVLAGDGGMIFFGGGDGYLYAVDANNGQQKWKVELGSFDTRILAVHNNLVFALSSDAISESIPNRLCAVDSLTGAKRWTYEMSDSRVHSLTVSGEDLFVTTQPILVNCLSEPICLNAETNRGSIYTIDAETGREKRRLVLEGAVSWAPVVSNGILYTGVTTLDERNIMLWNGNIVAIDIATGREGWHYATDYKGDFGQPLIDDGTIYVGDDLGAVFALQNP